MRLKIKFNHNLSKTLNIFKFKIKLIIALTFVITKDYKVY